jgi:uncharacterized protein with NRDE domain
MAYKMHTDYPFLVLANRDEYYERPTENAHWWKEAPNILAGKDLKAGGTWLGLTASGKFCALTNYRDPQNFNPTARSRGHIVSDYLANAIPAPDFISKSLTDTSAYNDFNLVCYEAEQLYYFGSKEGKVKALSPGIYGLSNALLDTDWPKVIHGKTELNQWIQQESLNAEEGFEILKNPTMASDELLPKTGISVEFERLLSAMHIHVEDYGTRSSNVIIFQQNAIDFHEKDHLNQQEYFYKIQL